VSLLTDSHPERRLVGIDPDERKIAWARASVGRNPNVELYACTIEALATVRPAAFDSIFIADVLCLVARASWPSFLNAARQLLRPGGRLLLKDAENDGSWRVTKALWQERLMVRLLRRTHASGIGFASRAEWHDVLAAAGFAVDETIVFRGYTAPHVLFTAHAR
jgi:2-polyprenyl-6-hydroxyphenyl methylase/3-demethylubiquinone-9 3-methyltransferase